MTTEQRDYVSKLAPLDKRLAPQQYSFIGYKPPVIYPVTIEHNHTSAINTIYGWSGGDGAYQQNAINSGIAHSWKYNQESIQSGTIIDPITQWPSLAGSETLTTMNTAWYAKGESDSEKIG